MTDVFISYASEDRQIAECLASCLAQSGWSVWWDRNIIIGQAYDLAIEHQLETANSVVVLWSKHSVVSEWVKNEAALASERGVLVPANIDHTKLPLEFRRKQTADLADWNGELSHSGFQALSKGLASKISGRQTSNPLTLQDKKSPRILGWALAVFISICTVMLLRAFYLDSGYGLATPTSMTTTAEKPTSNEINTELSQLVVGEFYGDVIADSKGSSRSNIMLTITRLDSYNVRVTSDYPRLGSVELRLTRIGNQIFNEGGDSVFIVDLNRSPITLDFNPHNEVAFSGRKQQ